MFTMEDSLFGTVDEWTMHQLRHILDQQRHLMEQLNVPPIPAGQLVVSKDVSGTCGHVDNCGEKSLVAKEMMECRQPRMHAAVLPTEEKQTKSASATIQPVVNKNLDQPTLPPSESISSKMAESSCTILSAIGPQQPPFITNTHTPGITSSPEELQQLVNIRVGGLSGSRHTDVILDGDHKQVRHAAVVRPRRHINTGIVKHSPCVSPARPGPRYISVLFRMVNKDVHHGQSTSRSDRSGSKSVESAERVVRTGRQPLKTTGGKALRATKTKTKATLLFIKSSLRITQNHHQPVQLNQQFEVIRVISFINVQEYIIWPWDPGELLLHVWPSIKHISTEHRPVSCKLAAIETSPDRTRQNVVGVKSWSFSTGASLPSTFRITVYTHVKQVNNEDRMLDFVQPATSWTSSIKGEVLGCDPIRTRHHTVIMTFIIKCHPTG